MSPNDMNQSNKVSATPDAQPQRSHPVTYSFFPTARNDINQSLEVRATPDAQPQRSPPVTYSFFPMSPNDMNQSHEVSSTPDAQPQRSPPVTYPFFPMSPNEMNRVRHLSFSSQNLNHHPGGDSPPELMPTHSLGFLLPRAPNPNAARPLIYSFFPLSPNNMDPTSPTPDTANPTPSCPPTFAPSQTVNPRSSQRFLQSQEASPASWPADSPPVLRRQCITTDSEIRRQVPAKLIEEAKRAEAARISHPRLQISNPPAQVAKQTPKSDPVARNITKSAPSRVRKATSYKATASDLFSVAKALGGDRLLDLVCTAHASYVLKNETEGGRREPSDQSEVDQN